MGGITPHLVDVVPEAFELLYSTSCLLIRIVPRPDGSHTGRLVSGIALSAVVKIRVGPSWTISRGRLNKLYEIMCSFTHTQMFPVMAMCGHRWGLHITATTAILTPR